MKITIIGTGGVGGYFGARLALSGNEVHFVARGAHLEAIQKNGLLVKSTQGEFSVNPARASERYDSVQQADLVLVCTKAWQVRDVAQTIAPLLNPEAMVVPLQNGVLAADELAEFIPKQQVVGGLCRIFSKIEAPGVISHFGADPTLVFGELDHAQTDRCAWLKYTFTMAGLTNFWSEHIQTDLWKKFLMINSSALLAVLRAPYGVVRSMPETRQMLEALYHEVLTVGRAAGVPLPDDLVEKTMKAVDAFPSDSTSSLTRDVWEGRPSELDYQNGTVVRLGEQFGVETPVNRFVYHALLPQERRARGE